MNGPTMNACFRHRARRSTTWLCLAAALGSTGCAASGAMMDPAAPAMDMPAMDSGFAGDAASVAPVAPAQAPATLGATSPRSPGGAPSAPPSLPAAPNMPAAPNKSTVAPTAAQGAKEVQTKSAELGGDVEQMLIFTGRLDLMVDHEQVTPTLNEVIDLAAKRGGYIHQQTDQSVTLRVPSGRFRETMRAFEELGEVTHRSVQAQDVTEQFFDLGVRLESLLATRDRLEGFLDRAKTIEEVLRIEQELRRLNGEIDQLEGQRRYLSAQAAYSTITVALSPRPETKVIVEAKKEDGPPPPPPPPKTLVLPIEWFGDVSLDRLLQLEKE